VSEDLPAPTIGRAASQAILTIDLDALVANWRAMGGRCGNAECAAVVKADAYGVGLERAVSALSRAGCRTFFVAHASEAARARKALAGAPARIHALNGLLPGPGAREAAQALIACEASPVIGSPEEWESWIAAAGDRSCAVHIDTGMNRLGMSADEARALAAHPRADAIDLVMSHFVASEEAGDPLNDAQVAAFETLRRLFPQARASMANSSGVLLAARPHYDLVRPGYALYGGNPAPGAQNPMSPVVTLEAPILRLRHVETGASVGYNATWRAQRPSVLATLGLGYADGVLRSASGSNGRAGGEAIVAGVRCPFVGRVSMDLIVLDVTEAAGAGLAPGAMALVLGPQITIDDLAERAGSIGYEILTSLGRRYHRVYLGG
jgi:alanine racemase